MNKKKLITNLTRDKETPQKNNNNKTLKHEKFTLLRVD